MTALVTVLIAGTAVACSGGSPPTIKLDGSAHRPTDAGVVTSADRHHVVLDGARHYSVDAHLVVFTPGTLQLAPLTGTLGRYALVGATHGKIEWIEALAVVASLPGGAPTVFFFGTLTSVAGATATFRDGTVLSLVPGVTLPTAVSLPARVRADIDPTSHQVRTLVLRA